MEISCIFGRDLFPSGGLVTAFIKSNILSLNDNSSFDNCKIYVQAYGHASVDPRFSKNYKYETTGEGDNTIQSLFLQTVEYPPIDVITQIPHSNHSNKDNTYCIMCTQKELIPLKDILNGIFLQFNLDFILLPTFRGLCASINYFITISIKSSDEKISKEVSFPFYVIGKGITNLMLPYNVKFNLISLIPADSLANDIVYIQSPDMISDDSEISITEELELGMVYTTQQVTLNIRDEQHICSIQIFMSPIRTSNSIYLFPGQSFKIGFDFSSKKQPCYSLRGRLLQHEKRLDGKLIQEKVIHSLSRHTINSYSFVLQFNIPEGTSCTFKCPVMMISYELELEFNLNDPNLIDEDEKEPQIMTIPCIILPPKRALHSLSEINLCNDPCCSYNEIIKFD